MMKGLCVGVLLLNSLLVTVVKAGAKRRSRRDDEPHHKITTCADLPRWSALKEALCLATMGDGTCEKDPSHGGFNFHMWATLVDRDGTVCAVSFTGKNRGSQWPGSRVISAQKANTANSFSLPGFALSSANLWEATRDQGNLADLVESNPVVPSVAYGGQDKDKGMSRDPLRGEKVGGVNIFGGGLGLYDEHGTLLGGLGVSGDTSCEDHSIAWLARKYLGLDNVPGGPVSAFELMEGELGDALIFTDSASTAGFGHPHCFNDDDGVGYVR